MKKTNHLIAIVIAIFVSFLYFNFVIEQNKLFSDKSEVKGNEDLAENSSTIHWPKLK